MAGVYGPTKNTLYYLQKIYPDEIEEDAVLDFYLASIKKDHRPLSIEEVASANGDWELPIDKYGDWKKNPIDVEKSEDFDIIY